MNITMVHNELYGELFTLHNNVIWNTAALDREYQDAYNLLIIAYGDAGVTTANVSVFSHSDSKRGCSSNGRALA